MPTMKEIRYIEQDLEESLREDAARRFPFSDKRRRYLMLQICAAARRGVEADHELQNAFEEAKIKRMKLRWLEMPYETGIYADHPCAMDAPDGVVRVLQQWWAGPPEAGYGNDIPTGEWRDIPIAREA